MVAAADVDAAADAAEKLEECARLYLLLESSGRSYRVLTPAELDRAVARDAARR